MIADQPLKPLPKAKLRSFTYWKLEQHFLTHFPRPPLAWCWPMRGGGLRRGVVEAPREAGLTPPGRLGSLPSPGQHRQPLWGLNWRRRPQRGILFWDARRLEESFFGVDLHNIHTSGSFLFPFNDVLETVRKTFPLAWTVDPNTWALVLQVKYRDWVRVAGEIFPYFICFYFCGK